MVSRLWEGRVVANPVMVVGIGFLTLVIGAFFERFVASEVAAVEREVAEGVDSSEVELED